MENPQMEQAVMQGHAEKQQTEKTTQKKFYHCAH